MKIARYQYNNYETYGLLVEETVVSLPELAKHFDEELPSNVEDFVNEGEPALKVAEGLIRRIRKNLAGVAFTPLKKVAFLAPITKPPKIICLGVNYCDHARETSAAIPEEPILFMKPRTAIIGPNDKIAKPRFIKQLDYEGELAIVIGKKTKNVPTAEAKNHVFGYTVFNDVSAREIQFGDRQWTRGKSFDTFAPTGPCIVTESQLKNTNDIGIRTWVNGELRQNGTTKNMVFSIEKIVHQLSRVMTLEPCDIIATGTPSGVGMAMNPQKWLKNGDVIRIEIEGIGVLENTVKETS